MSERFHINSELCIGPVLVTGPEAHHLAKVCRLRRGDAVCLFNGDGREYHGHLVQIRGQEVEVEIERIESPVREHPFTLHLGVALPKGDRGQFLVEKCTELGVTRLTLLQAKRSVVVPRETRLDKLQRYVVEASKQCGRNVLMQVEGPVELRSFLREESLGENKWLAHPGEGISAEIPCASREKVVAVVGPEGGFTDEEVQLAREWGWRVWHLGPRILRVETAALVVATRLGYQ